MQEERRTPSQETIDNSKAIAKLTAISERTTLDVDKLVKHIEKILPVHEQIANLKKIVYASLSVATLYVAWQATGYFSLKETVSSNIAVQKTKEDISKKNIEKLTKAIHKNENQITYLKGRIK